MEKDKVGDPMDRFSHFQPLGRNKLAKLFALDARNDPAKPGRELRVVFDERFPLIDGFEPRYQYTVAFDSKGSSAGNHYHEKKEELFIPVSGKFTIALQGVLSREKTEIKLDSKEHRILYVPSGVAHLVVAEQEGSVLLVLATYPNNKEDEHEYEITR